MIVSVTYGLCWDVWREDGGRWGGAVTTYSGETVFDVGGERSRWEVQSRLLAAMRRYAARQSAAA